LYPYGDTRTHPEPQPVYDHHDDRAARRTIRLLAVGLFVAVAGLTVFLTLASIRGGDSSGSAPAAETVTTLPPPAEVGPAPGTEVAPYVTARKAALAANTEDRAAVVSLVKYSTEAQARTLAGTNTVVALLVAPPGVGPAVVTGDLAAWSKEQTATLTAERDEIRKLIPTVTDAAFKSFYNAEVARLDKALKNFAPTSAMVFGMVVKAPAAALKTLGAKAEVRLVDLAPTATPAPDTIYRGLRPEETAKANEPPLRP
jgi:hypothetical protein